jgi:Zn-dependent peptidase ImmA (M78 family)
MSIARQSAQRLLRRAGITQAPIKVDEIAKGLGLKVIATEIPNKVSGLLVTHDAVSTICLQKGDSAVRQRFTVAHELGHWYLQHQAQSGPHVHVNRGHLISERGARSAEGSDRVEIEANQFAAELLMPGNLVRAAVARLKRPLREDDVSDLAGEFEVSEQAMGFRLKNLRLI